MDDTTKFLKIFNKLINILTSDEQQDLYMILNNIQGQDGDMENVHFKQLSH